MREKRKGRKAMADEISREEVKAIFSGFDLHEARFTTEPMKTKYEFCNAWFAKAGEDGKLKEYKVCDACGKGVHSNAGYEIRYDGGRGFGSARGGYCRKCANKLIPILTEALDKLHEKQEEMRGERE